MGEVWTGYDRRLDRPVAVKLLRAARFPTGTDMTVLSRRFARESRLTARIEHRGVPAVFDAGTDEGDLFLVMQLVGGADLADVLAEHGPLSVPWATAVTAQVAAVLAVAHDAPLVHRDLKPRNVMLSPDGAVTVLDFGVAAVLEPSASRLTSTGETLGSPAYMALEQAMEGAASPRSDLYALGCILHELLAGEPVFGGDRPLAVLHRHLEDEPTPLRALRPDVPEDVEHLVLALLAKDPESRPVDARAVHARLVPHVVDDGSEPGSMAPTTPFRRPTSPPARRSPVPVAAAPADDDVTVRAEALMDDGRYTQAAEVLEEALRSATSSGDVWRLGIGLATAHFLGGDHRRALGYRAMIAETQDDPARAELRFRLRSQIAFCLVELGETAEALVR